MSRTSSSGDTTKGGRSAERLVAPKSRHSQTEEEGRAQPSRSQGRDGGQPHPGSRICCVCRCRDLVPRAWEKGRRRGTSAKRGTLVSSQGCSILRRYGRCGTTRTLGRTIFSLPTAQTGYEENPGAATALAARLLNTAKLQDRASGKNSFPFSGIIFAQPLTASQGWIFRIGTATNPAQPWLVPWIDRLAYRSVLQARTCPCRKHRLSLSRAHG